MAISKATLRDIEPLAELVNGAYRGEGAKRGWTTEAQRIGGQRTDARMLADDLARGTILLEHENEKLIGCVYLEICRPRVLYFGMLTIAPERQSSGLGTRLLDAVENYARTHEATRVEMWVYAYRDTLIAWYVRRGYQPTGETLASTGDDKYGVPKQEGLYLIRMGRDLGATAAATAGTDA